MKNLGTYKGGDDSLDFGNTMYGENLFVMHNHPRNSSYSSTDIVFLMKSDNVKTLSIVKNNGAVEVLTKTENYDMLALRDDFKRIIKKSVKMESKAEYDRAVQKLLNKHSTQGGMFEWIK